MSFEPHILILSLALLILAVLAFIDFKTLKLPNKWVLAYAILSVPYRFWFGFDWAILTDMLFGLLSALIMLGGIRALFNHRYKQETFGVGDIKLLMAGGLWLGFPSIITAIAVGAIAGIIMGVVIYFSTRQDEQRLGQTKFAAGPGFILGLALLMIMPFIEKYFMLEFPL